MTDTAKPPRRGGSVTLPKNATKDDIDDALRKAGDQKSDPAPQPKEKK